MDRRLLHFSAALYSPRSLLYDLLNDSAEERRIFMNALNQSWRGESFSINSARYFGTLQFAHWMPESEFKRFAEIEEWMAASPRPPVLLVSTGTPKFTSGEKISEAERGWEFFCWFLIQSRFGGPVGYKLSAEATALVEAFAAEQAKALATLPPASAPWNDTGNELVLKVAGLFHLATRPTEAEIDAATVSAAIAVSSWLLRHHSENVDRLFFGRRKKKVVSAATDWADAMKVMEGKIRAKQPITWDQIRNSYNHKPAHWLREVLNRLIADGRVQQVDGVTFVTADYRGDGVESEEKSPRAKMGSSKIRDGPATV